MQITSKITFITMLITFFITVISSFTFKKLSPVTFYYKTGTADQRIECGVTTPGPEHSLTSSSYTNVNNWTVSDQGEDGYTFNDGTSYVRSITIDDFEATSDGDDDGQISLQEALNVINAQYISTCTYPSYTTIVTVDANNSGGSATISQFTRNENVNIP